VRTTTLRERGLILGPFDATIPTVLTEWRRVLVETVGGLDDGAALYFVGSIDRRHAFTLTISPGTSSGSACALRLPLTFALTVQDRLVVEGECGLEFSPWDGARRTTIADLLGTVRWSTSRLRRFRMLGRSAMGVDDAVGRSYQSFLTALERESLNWR
jgi:hypothetical protein